MHVTGRSRAWRHLEKVRRVAVVHHVSLSASIRPHFRKRLTLSLGACKRLISLVIRNHVVLRSAKFVSRRLRAAFERTPHVRSGSGISERMVTCKNSKFPSTNFWAGFSSGSWSTVSARSRYPSAHIIKTIFLKKVNRRVIQQLFWRFFYFPATDTYGYRHSAVLSRSESLPEITRRIETP